MVSKEQFTSREDVAEAIRDLKGARGDAVFEGMLGNLLEQHALDVAEKKQAVQEIVSALPTQVLDMKWSDFKKAGYPTTTGASENDNPNGA